jgi:hypothetical protein
MDSETDEVRAWLMRAQQLRELGAFEKDPRSAEALLARASDLEAKAAAAAKLAGRVDAR